MVGENTDYWAPPQNVWSGKAPKFEFLTSPQECWCRSSQCENHCLGRSRTSSERRKDWTGPWRIPDEPRQVRNVIIILSKLHISRDDSLYLFMSTWPSKWSLGKTWHLMIHALRQCAFNFIYLLMWRSVDVGFSYQQLIGNEWSTFPFSNNARLLEIHRYRVELLGMYLNVIHFVKSYLG